MNLTISQSFGLKSNSTCDQIAIQINQYFQGKISLHHSEYKGDYAKILHLQARISIHKNEYEAYEYYFPQYSNLSIIVSVHINKGKKIERINLAQNILNHMQNLGFIMLEQSQNSSTQ